MEKSEADRIDLQIKVINSITRLARTRFGLSPRDTKIFKYTLDILIKGWHTSRTEDYPLK